MQKYLFLIKCKSCSHAKELRSITDLKLSPKTISKLVCSNCNEKDPEIKQLYPKEGEDFPNRAYGFHGSNGGTISQPLPDPDYDPGPRNDDWEPSDWEDHFGGPNY